MPTEPKPLYNHWEPLHRYAVEHCDNWDQAKAQAFYKQWQRNIPASKTCDCKKNWKQLKLKPDYSSAQAFFEWAWRAHNTVNSKLDKPVVSLCECYQKWWQERMTNRTGALTCDKSTDTSENNAAIAESVTDSDSVS